MIVGAALTIVGYLQQLFPNVPFGDEAHTVLAFTNEFKFEKYIMVKVLDDGRFFVELGGNWDKVAAGAGFYINSFTTVSAGISTKWKNIFGGGTPTFYIGFSLEF